MHRSSASPTSSSAGSELSTALEQIRVTPLRAEDWEAATRVYEAGIAGGNATFESGAPAWEDWAPARARYPAIAARGSDGQMLGWAALSPTSSRAVYRGVGEVSIYVNPACARRGVGRVLMNALIETSEHEGFWTLRAGIFPENTASIALHESAGFQLLGTSERIGQMPDGRWRDVLMYERRSTTVGQDDQLPSQGGVLSRSRV
jgi:L-amino acid N-acyltransferase YncA